MAEMMYKVFVMLLSENRSQPHDECKIPTRAATKSTLKMATSHISLIAMSIQTARSRPLAPLLSTDNTLAAHHCQMVVLLWPAVLMKVHALSHHTVAPNLSSGFPRLKARSRMSHPQVAFHRTNGYGTLLAACPCEPGRTSRTGVAAAPSWPLLRSSLDDAAQGPPPFQWHHPGGPPMPVFPYPFPWHFNPYNPWPPHHSYVQQPPFQS